MTIQQRPVSAPTYRERLLREVTRAVEERLDELTARGEDVAGLGDPAGLARRVAAALPSAPHPYDAALGPFYDTAGLSTWLGVSRQALSDRVRRGTLLACRTDDGHLVYPAFQFTRTGETRPGVVDVVGVMTRAGVDGWTTAVWLTTPTPAFDGQSAVDHLVVHRASAAAVSRVVEQARVDAAAWAA